MKPNPRLLTLRVLLTVLPRLLAILLLHAGCSSCKKVPTSVTALPGSKAGVAFDQPSGPGDELWIIARGETSTASTNDDTPGEGSLLAKVDEKEIPMPLKHTDVHASVSGYIGEVEVRQQFQNPYERKIEAVYVFPLLHNAAVNEFIMTISDRRIRGIIRERADAQKIYEEAKRQGYAASLLTEERPNVFTQSVANIEPGKEIDVDIKYFHTLEYVDGWYEFVFPMVVGPRYNPSGATDGIGAVPRGQAGASGQSTEVSYLKPGERSGHDISLKVDVDAGVPIEDFKCQNHQVTMRTNASGHLSVTLNPTDASPNRDFILRYRIAGDQIKPSLLTTHDERGGFFTLMLYPPSDLKALQREPIEMVFVLDCSGSMNGRPITQAKAAVERTLHLLQPGDSFQIISFSMTASQLGEKPLQATPQNIQRGLAYLRSLRSEGGTEMIEGIKAALDFPHDSKRPRFVCFLTDGYIGNEAQILGEIHERLGASRIFSFGIGSSVNRYLIESMARAGHGAVAYLGPNDNAARIMEDFFERVSHPAMTNVKIDWGGWNVPEVFPSHTPDLFVGRPVILTGRFAGNENTTIRANGTAAGQPVQLTIPANISNANAAPKSLPVLWARMKIASLSDESTYSANESIPPKIKEIALDYGLVSSFTAFIAVDATRITDGNKAATVPVAVPVPDGVKNKKTIEGE